MRHFYNSMDIQDLLGFGSIRTAQLRIQAMNEELKSKGYWTERGKVPVKFFHEKYPYVQESQQITSKSDSIVIPLSRSSRT